MSRFTNPLPHALDQSHSDKGIKPLVSRILKGKSRKVFDFFAVDGRFVGRMSLGADFFVPNLNCPGAWIYRDGEEMLVPFPEP